MSNPDSAASSAPGIRSNLPPDLAAVALVDARTAAAAGGMGVSWWHKQVRLGAAPQPAVRATRCTRWRSSEVAAFWRNYPGRPQAQEARK